jgi:addiction module HigA family antidote
MATQRKMPPIHPGEILHREFLSPLGISQYRLAKDMSVPPRRINEIVRGQRAISADTALRLAPLFRHIRAVLVESANPLRFATRKGQVGKTAGTRSRSAFYD